MKKDYRDLEGAPLEEIMNQIPFYKAKHWKKLVKKLERIFTENVARTELDPEERKKYPYTKDNMRFKIPGIIVYDEDGYSEILWTDSSVYETNPDVLDDLIEQCQRHLEGTYEMRFVDKNTDDNVIPFKGRD